MTSSARNQESTRGAGTAAVWAALRRAAGWPLRVYRARAVMHRLANLDPCELRDIGLTRGDLNDASALAWDVDPTLTLRRRAEERRRWRR